MKGELQGIEAAHWAAMLLWSIVGCHAPMEYSSGRFYGYSHFIQR